METREAKLEDAIKAYDQIVQNMDGIIEYAQRRRNALVERRAQLDILKKLQTPPQASSKCVGEIVGVGAAVGYFVDVALEEANRRMEKEQRQTERELEQQREWFDEVQRESSGH